MSIIKFIKSFINFFRGENSDVIEYSESDCDVTYDNYFLFMINYPGDYVEFEEI